MAVPDARASGRRPGRVFLVILGLCAVALVHGVRTTGDLNWSYDPDHFRDIAHAQTIRDGGLWRDPFYLDETTWYNPLVPSIVATISYLADAPVSVTYTRAGAYLNLFAPLMLYLLASVLLDRRSALAAVCCFLFVRAEPSWAVPTYSPWIFPSSVAQGLFYLTLAAYTRAFRARTYGAHLTVGILLGLTFLGHTAPAILLGVIITAGTVYQMLPARTHGFDRRFARQTVVCFAIVVTSALVVSAPFLVSIVGHYRLSLQNRVPTIWLDPSIELANWRAFMAANLSPSLLNAFFALGLIRIVAARRRVEAMVIMVWLTTALGLFLYSAYGWQIMQARGVQIPTLLPAHHFLFYFRGAQTVLFGYGVAVLPGMLASGVRLLRTLPPLSHAEVRTRVETTVFAVLVVGIVIGYYPAFAERDDFVGLRDQALDMYATPDSVNLFRWIRAYTVATDVFLAPDNVGLAIVGSAGRKLVAVDPFFSNPYVDWGARDAARRAMWESLAAGNCGRFHEVVEGYRVGYVILVQSVTPAVADVIRTCVLKPVFWIGQFAVLRIAR